MSLDKRGSVGEMIGIALPMVVSFACETAMTFTDRLFLARLGPEHMSAAMGGGVSAFMMMSFFLGLVGYTTALTAQYLGANQKHHCSQVLTQAVILVLGAYPLLLLARPLAHALFSASGISPGQLVLQTEYFNILIYGVVIALGRHALSCYFSGIGRTRIVMIGALTAMIVNVLANYCLIYGKFGVPALGIRGAAIGTIIGGASGLTVLLSSYFSEKNVREFDVTGSWHFDRVVMGKLLRYGYPAGFEMLLNILAFTVLIFIFHSQGPAAAAATTIVFNWDMVTFVPLLGIEIGVTSLVGRYMGSQQPDIAHKAVNSGLKIGFMYSALMLGLFLFLPEQLVNLFHPNTVNAVFIEAAPLAVAMIKLVVLYVTAEAVLIVFIGALRGAGDTLWAMAVSVGIHWLIVATVFVALNWFHLSTQTAWTILVGIFLVFCALPYLRYRQGKWKNIRMIEPEIPSLIPADTFHEPPL